MRGKRGLAKEIIRLFAMGHTNAEIKKLVGCSSANVTQVLRRRGFTEEIRASRRMRPFQQRHREYLERSALEHHTTIEHRIRALLLDAIDQAIEEETDIKCISHSVSKLQNLPIPRTLSDRARPGSGPA